MADLELVREDGNGEQTIVKVRVPDSAWAGNEPVIQVLAVEHRIPQQREGS